MLDFSQLIGFWSRRFKEFTSADKILLGKSCSFVELESFKWYNLFTPKCVPDDFTLLPEHVTQMKIGRLILIKPYSNVWASPKAGLHNHIHNLAHVKT